MARRVLTSDEMLRMTVRNTRSDVTIFIKDYNVNKCNCVLMYGQKMYEL